MVTLGLHCSTVCLMSGRSWVPFYVRGFPQIRVSWLNLHSLFEVAGFGVKRGKRNWLQWVRSLKQKKKHACLCSDNSQETKNDQTHFCVCFFLSLISALSPFAFCCLRHVHFSFVIQISWRSSATERALCYWPSTTRSATCTYLLLPLFSVVNDV